MRELFEQEPPPPPRKTRAELMKDIDADYYGYRDEDDGILIPLEEEEQKKAMGESIENWKKNKEKQITGEEKEFEEEEDIYAVKNDVRRFIKLVYGILKSILNICIIFLLVWIGRR